ncbi:MAG: heat-inducible transcriptional repressor HrcA [Holosporales bacterium]|jgi:heat-inducible transcriptional repressor|nr:heat-inducible transcriptional repressor HrcA [Holosporales bacterium]
MTIENNKRYAEIFKELVDEYIETGEPVGSRTLSKRMDRVLSPATIRNVMSDLEDLGILYSEHTSSGRKPTERGWRYFVNSIIEISPADLQAADIKAFSETEKSLSGRSVGTILDKASDILSYLSNYASIVITPTANDKIVRHIDFVLLSPGKALVIIVSHDGDIENRLIEVPTDISNSVLEMAAKYLNTKLCGLTLSGIRDTVYDELSVARDGLNFAANDIVKKGIGVWKIGDEFEGDKIIVKGQSNLMSNIDEIKNLEVLFRKLDQKNTVKNLLDESIKGKGIQVFIGSENKAFDLEGCSMIISPYKNSEKKVIGAIGVIGPERMRYSRVIKLVDYTTKMLEKMV